MKRSLRHCHENVRGRVSLRPPIVSRPRSFSLPTHIVTLLDVVPVRQVDVVEERPFSVSGAELYSDVFDNICRRIQGYPGTVRIISGIIQDSGLPDRIELLAAKVPISALPSGTLVFFLASRYCETDLLVQTAWDRFGWVQRAGQKFKRCAISSTAISNLIMAVQDQRAQPPKP